MSMTPEQLAALQDGDKVILAQDGYNPWRRVTTVRLTATQVIADKPPHEYRFDRTTGRLKGDRGYWSTELCPYTEEARLKIQTNHASQEAKAVLGKLTLAQIEALELGPCVELHSQLTHLMRALATCGLYDNEKVDKL
jgi:hypothetical protein